MAVATCCFALASCDRMSTSIWFSIFSGSSAREIRSLMFDRSSVDSLSKSPMWLASVCLPIGAELADVRGESDTDALVRSLEFLVIEMRELQRLGDDNRVLLDAIRPMEQVRRVQLEQAPTQRGQLVFILGKGHDLHAHQDHGRRVVDDEREIELAAGLYDP